MSQLLKQRFLFFYMFGFLRNMISVFGRSYYTQEIKTERQMKKNVIVDFNCLKSLMCPLVIKYWIIKLFPKLCNDVM